MWIGHTQREVGAENSSGNAALRCAWGFLQEGRTVCAYISGNMLFGLILRQTGTLSTIVLLTPPPFLFNENLDISLVIVLYYIKVY